MAPQVKIVKNKQIKINFKFVCDWFFPIYLLPMINLFKGDGNFTIEIGWVIFRAEMVIYY